MHTSPELFTVSGLFALAGILMAMLVLAIVVEVGKRRK